MVRRRNVRGHTIYQCAIGANRTRHHDHALLHSHNGAACHFNERRRRKTALRILKMAVSSGGLPLCYTTSKKGGRVEFGSPDGIAELRAGLQTGFGMRDTISFDVGFASPSAGTAFALDAMRKCSVP